MQNNERVNFPHKGKILEIWKMPQMLNTTFSTMSLISIMLPKWTYYLACRFAQVITQLDTATASVLPMKHNNFMVDSCPFKKLNGIQSG